MTTSVNRALADLLHQEQQRNKRFKIPQRPRHQINSQNLTTLDI